jgi:hypothetical protein
MFLFAGLYSLQILKLKNHDSLSDACSVVAVAGFIASRSGYLLDCGG